jgi:hypothetical protein
VCVNDNQTVALTGRVCVVALGKVYWKKGHVKGTHSTRTTPLEELSKL